MTITQTIVNEVEHATGHDVYIMPGYFTTHAGVFVVNVGTLGSIEQLESCHYLTRDARPLWVTHELHETNDSAREACKDIARLYVRAGHDIHAITE